MDITVKHRLERFMSKIDINCQPSLTTTSLTLGCVIMSSLYAVCRVLKPMSLETHQYIPTTYDINVLLTKYNPTGSITYDASET